MSEELATLVVDQRGEVVVARVSGEIDISNAQTIRSELITVALKGRGLALDLSALTYLDSAGIAMIDSLHRALHEDGRTLRIVAPPGAVVHRVLTLSSMAEIVPVDPSEDAAVRGLIAS